MSRNGFPPLRPLEASLAPQFANAASVSVESPVSAESVHATLDTVRSLCEEAMRLQRESPIGGISSDYFPVRRAWLACDNACRKLIITSDQPEAVREEVRTLLLSIGISSQRASLMVS